MGQGFRATLIVPQATLSDGIANRDHGNNTHD